MSTNLHALIRYRILDDCFHQRRRNQNWKALAHACGDALREYTRSDMKDPSRRTIFGDMDTMKHGKLGYDAPIEFSPECGYHYTDPKFTISGQPLTEEDRGILGEALFVLKQFRGFTRLPGLDGIITHLEHGILGESSPYKAAILMEQSERARGLNWIEPLFNAIRREQRIRLMYKPFTTPDAYSTEVSPYLLKEFNSRWYLAGYDHLNDRIQSYGLDRIEHIHELTLPIQASPVDLKAHYEKVIGVTVFPQKQEERIVFRAIPEQAWYIATKPIHHTQRILREGPEGTVFAIDVIPNFELESILLSYGERAEVLEPLLLRQSIRQRLHQAGTLYMEAGE